MHQAVTVNGFCNASGQCVNSVQLVKFWERNQILKMFFSPMNSKNQCSIHNRYLVSLRDTFHFLSSSLLRLPFLLANLKDDLFPLSYFMTLIQAEQKIKSKKGVFIKALLFFSFSLVFLLQTARCQKSII